MSLRESPAIAACAVSTQQESWSKPPRARQPLCAAHDGGAGTRLRGRRGRHRLAHRCFRVLRPLAGRRPWRAAVVGDGAIVVREPPPDVETVLPHRVPARLSSSASRTPRRCARALSPTAPVSYASCATTPTGSVSARSPTRPGTAGPSASRSPTSPPAVGRAWSTWLGPGGIVGRLSPTAAGTALSLTRRRPSPCFTSGCGPTGTSRRRPSRLTCTCTRSRRPAQQRPRPLQRQLQRPRSRPGQARPFSEHAAAAQLGAVERRRGRGRSRSCRGSARGAKRVGELRRPAVGARDVAVGADAQMLLILSCHSSPLGDPSHGGLR